MDVPWVAHHLRAIASEGNMLCQTLPKLLPKCIMFERVPEMSECLCVARIRQHVRLKLLLQHTQ